MRSRCSTSASPTRRTVPDDSFQAIRVATLPGGGTLTNNGVPVTAGAFVGVADLLAGKLVYTPFANASGVGYATLGFQVQDSGGTAGGGSDLDPLVRTLTIDVAAVNDPPVNAVPASQSTPGGTPLTFSSANGNAITVSDIDENGGGLGITLTGVNGTLTLSTTAGLSGVTGNGTASVSFSGSPDGINDALDGLMFTPNAGFFGAGGLQIVTDDLGNTGSPGPLQAMSSVAIDVTYTAPSLTMNATPLSYVENDPATPVDPGLTITAGSFGALTGAQVRISANYASGQDVLDFSLVVLPGGVAATWSPGTGTLSFSGTATLAEYEALLRSVTYQNTSEAPSAATRTVTFTVNDVAGNDERLTAGGRELGQRRAHRRASSPTSRSRRAPAAARSRSRSATWRPRRGPWWSRRRPATARCCPTATSRWAGRARTGPSASPRWRASMAAPRSP